MRLLGRHITVAVHVSRSEDDVFSDIHVIEGCYEYCGLQVTSIRIGVGAVVFDVFVQKAH